MHTILLFYILLCGHYCHYSNMQMIRSSVFVRSVKYAYYSNMHSSGNPSPCWISTFDSFSIIRKMHTYGWNHRNTTWTSIQISQLLEWVRPCKWVRSKATGHVRSPKYTITRDILYLLISQQNFRKTSIQISDGENSFMRKFWWKIFFVRFLIMKKVYIIWSHELIEKLDFYGLFYRHGDFSHAFHEILTLGSSSKNNYSSYMWLFGSIPWSFMMKYMHF